MHFTEQDLKLVADLCGVAWAAGVVKSPQMAQAIETLRMKVHGALEPKKAEAPAVAPPMKKVK